MRMRTTTCGDDRTLNNSRGEQQQQSRVLYYMSSATGEEKERERERERAEWKPRKTRDVRSFYLLLVQTNDAHTRERERDILWIPCSEMCLTFPCCAHTTTAKDRTCGKLWTDGSKVSDWANTRRWRERRRISRAEGRSSSDSLTAESIWSRNNLIATIESYFIVIIHRDTITADGLPTDVYVEKQQRWGGWRQQLTNIN